VGSIVQVSVIMPALNAARFIEQALMSLVRERDTVPLDIVVVDDSSTDDTRDIVARLADTYPEIRLFPNPRKGIAAGRNTAIKLAKPESPFISFLDADDISCPGRLARQRALLAADPSIGAVYGLVQMFSQLDEATQAPAAGSPTRIMRGPYLQSSMYRADAIRALGPFDETFRQGDDTDFVLRAISHPVKLHLEDALAAYYRRHDANVTLNVEEVQREFWLASLKWAARRRLKGNAEIPKIFSELFLSRHDLEKDFGT
jgi:glycosyltransferase involved in cell wall biosynthesis